MLDLGIEENLQKYVYSLINEEEKRMDGRNLLEYRNIKIEKGYIENAEGSCYVELGNTKVLAGIKMEVAEPFEDIPDEGIFVVSLEQLPSSHPEVEPGPPDEKAIEYARIVDRVIRESRFINTKELIIEPGKYVWRIFIDIYVLDDDGNIVDASTLATLGALLDAKFPKLEKKDDKYIVNPKEKTNKNLPLNLNKMPVMVSFAKIGNKFVLDPNRIEEEAADMIVHIGITDEVHAIQTRKSGMITLEEFDKLLEYSFSIRNNLLKLLK